MRQNARQNRPLTIAKIPPRKNRHAECNCGKTHAKIDYFSSKFEHQTFEIRASKFRHAEGDYGKKHSKVDDFSSKFEHHKFDTPVAIDSRRTPRKFPVLESKIPPRTPAVIMTNALTFRVGFDRAPYRKSARVFESRLSSIFMTGL